MTLNDKKLSLEIMILNSYLEYKENGYPTDPKIYRVKSNAETVDNICNYFEDAAHIPNIYIGVETGTFTDKLTIEPWGFGLVVDNRLKSGEIIFGPEQIKFEWVSKD